MSLHTTPPGKSMNWEAEATPLKTLLSDQREMIATIAKDHPRIASLMEQRQNHGNVKPADEGTSPSILPPRSDTKITRRQYSSPIAFPQDDATATGGTTALGLEADSAKPPLSKGIGSTLALRATTGFGVNAASSMPGLANGTSLEDFLSNSNLGDGRHGEIEGLRWSSNAAEFRKAQTSPSTEISSGLRALSLPKTGVSSGPGSPQRTPRTAPALVCGSDWRDFVKRELELTETRLAAQVTKVRESAAVAFDKTDRVREVAIQRIEQKLSAQEEVLTKLDRRLSEFNGSLRGLTEETESHIRRMDGADARVWEFRHQMEEEFRKKIAELAEQQQAASSKCKVFMSACDETTRRLGQRVKRLEAAMEENLGYPSADLARTLAAFQSRVEHIEEMQHRQARGALAQDVNDRLISISKASSDVGADARYMDAQRQLNNLAKVVDNIKSEAHGDDGWCSKLQQLETRFGGFRQKMDSQEQLYQAFDEKVRQDWEAKFDSLTKNIQDHAQRHFRDAERIDALDRWAKAVDTAVEELYNGGSSATSKSVHELRYRMGQAEDGILRLAGTWRKEMEIFRGSAIHGLNPDTVSAQLPTASNSNTADPCSTSSTITKKALLVGINYFGTRHELSGCINDAYSHKELIKTQFGFLEKHIRVLTEDQSFSNKPTKTNIMTSLEWLVADAKPGDCLYLQYSGHGTYYSDEGRNEIDRKDEAICPLDYNDASWPKNLILDAELHDQLFARIPLGVYLTCVFDCCHSGNMEDLPITHGRSATQTESPPNTKARFIPPPAQVQSRCAGRVNRGLKRTVEKKPGLGQLYVLSGCQDSETAKDDQVKKMGAFTWSLLQALADSNCEIKCSDLLGKTKRLLASPINYGQVPVLSTAIEEQKEHKFLQGAVPESGPYHTWRH